MSYRYMRIIVLFDLPTLTIFDKREYRFFRKFLVKNGFMMMQQSIYCKLVLNMTASNAIINNIRKNKPKAGLVQVLTITEKQFARIELITGYYQTSVLDSDQRLVIL